MSNMRWSEVPRSDLIGGVTNNSNEGGNNGGGGVSNSATTTPQIKNHSVTYHRGHLYCFGGYDGRRNHQTLRIYSIREGRWLTQNNANNNGIIALGDGGAASASTERFTIRDAPPPGRNGHTATLATSSRSRRSRREVARRRQYLLNQNNTTNNNNTSNNSQRRADNANNANTNAAASSSCAQNEVQNAVAELAKAIDAMDAVLDYNNNSNNSNSPNNNNGSRNNDGSGSIDTDGAINGNHTQINERYREAEARVAAARAALEHQQVDHIENDSSSSGGAEINAQGGDTIDETQSNIGQQQQQQQNQQQHQNNPNDDRMDEEEQHLNNPMEAEEDDDDDNPTNNNNNNNNGGGEELEEDEDAQIIIIGGWLGSGPLAASDMWVLDICGGLDRLRWFQPPVLGTPPGPCNMHSADFIPSRGEVYVFRGGNGREYLNDLHALDVETYNWRTVETQGTAPQQRANHSSALLDHNGKSELFIFGGWNGSERLNDIHILDTETSTWSTPRVLGVKPHPRAGMTLTALRGRLYLFGGSGTSSKCFDDLQVLDRKEMAWLDVNEEDEMASLNRRSGVGVGGHSPSAYYEDSWEMITDNNNGHGFNNDHNHHNHDRTSSWEMLGGQDGTQQQHHHDSNGIKFADWRSYAGANVGGAPMCSSANPNDEDMVPSVYVNGKTPERRAGHTATAVGRHIYVFGGSCGNEYLNDFFVLDTDPPPLMKITEPPSPQLYASRLRHFYNDEEFSDVTFLVEGRKVFGHKLVLSTVSDCFRAMFMTGFRESGSEKTEIEIPNCNYSSFVTMMEYIYTGRGPQHGIDVFTNVGMDRAIALLELADQFLLYNLKQILESILQPAVNGETYTYLLQVGQKTNASQLESYCKYFERNMNELLE